VTSLRSDPDPTTSYGDSLEDCLKVRMSARLWSTDPFTIDQFATGLSHGHVSENALAQLRSYHLLYPTRTLLLFFIGNWTTRTSRAFLSLDGHSTFPLVCCGVLLERLARQIIGRPDRSPPLFRYIYTLASFKSPLHRLAKTLRSYGKPGSWDGGTQLSIWDALCCETFSTN